MAASEVRPAPSIEEGAGRGAGMAWVVHPIRHEHKRTAILVSVAVLTAFLVYMNFHSVGWTVFALLLLVLGVADYIFPMYFRFSEWGVETRLLFYRRRKPWHALRSYWIHRNGVFLSPFPGRSRLEAYRGINVRFAANRDEVLAFVRERIERVDE